MGFMVEIARIDNHRKGVGALRVFDEKGAFQFGFLTCALGLREQHTLLDIGCGCLRGGKFFIPYLNAGNYFGIEPNTEFVDNGIRGELGDFHFRTKKPTFSADANFTLTTFGRQFDFLLAYSIFSHASPDMITRCCREAVAVMTKDSIFAATYIEGEESYTGTEWVGRQGARYRQEDLFALTESAGLHAESVSGWTHPGGQKWIVLKLP